MFYSLITKYLIIIKCGREPVEGVDQIMPMWVEMIVGFLVLAACALASYQLVRTQRKKSLLEQEAKAE